LEALDLTAIFGTEIRRRRAAQRQGSINPITVHTIRKKYLDGDRSVQGAAQKGIG
jgi:hypothetical protein